jgi:hypothetical protein
MAANQAHSTQGLDSWLTRLINAIINDFLKRAFWGPKRVFARILYTIPRKRSQNVTRILAVNLRKNGPN